MSDNDTVDRALRTYAAEWADELGTRSAPGITQLLADRRAGDPGRNRWTAAGLSAVAAGVVISAAVSIPQTRPAGQPGGSGVAVDTDTSAPASATATPAPSPSGLPTPLVLRSAATTNPPAAPGEETKTAGIGTPLPLNAEEKARADLQTRLVDVLQKTHGQLAKDPALTQEMIDLDKASVIILSRGPLADATKTALREAAKAHPAVTVVFDESAKYSRAELDAAIETLSNDPVMQSLSVLTISPAIDGSGLAVEVGGGDLADAKATLQDVAGVNVTVTVGPGVSTK